MTSRLAIGKALMRVRGRKLLAKAGKAPPPEEGPRIGPEEVSKAFQGVTSFLEPASGAAGEKAAPIDTYFAHLVALQEATAAHNQRGSLTEEQRETVHRAKAVVSAMIDRQELRWRPFFKQALWPPVESAGKILLE